MLPRTHSLTIHRSQLIATADRRVATTTTAVSARSAKRGLRECCKYAELHFQDVIFCFPCRLGESKQPTSVRHLATDDEQLAHASSPTAILCVHVGCGSTRMLVISFFCFCLVFDGHRGIGVLRA